MFRLRFPILTAAFAGLACVIILAAPARAGMIAGWDFSSGLLLELTISVLLR